MNDRTLLTGAAPMIFAGSPLDRCEALRRDPAAIDALFNASDTRAVLLCKGEPHLDRQGALTLYPPRFAPYQGDPVFLGKRGGQALFALDVAEADIDMLADAEGGFLNAREAAMTMPHEDAAIFAQARALIEWRRRHMYCSNCGAGTRQAGGGQKRICDGCQAEHFPRVDPVVIMLATDGERCLMGRQASWPPRMWSAMAGFVEPGETLEEAVARELNEESGVGVDPAKVRFVMGQPWPFPSQLMLGFIVEVDDSSVEVDTHELEAVRWFTRQEAADMLEGRHPDAEMPPSIAIARRLLELWSAEKI